MNEIITYVTLGMVFAFCALAVVLLLPTEKLFRRNSRKRKK